MTEVRTCGDKTKWNYRFNATWSPGKKWFDYDAPATGRSVGPHEIGFGYDTDELSPSTTGAPLM